MPSISDGSKRPISIRRRRKGRGGMMETRTGELKVRQGFGSRCMVWFEEGKIRLASLI